MLPRPSLFRHIVTRVRAFSHATEGCAWLRRRAGTPRWAPGTQPRGGKGKGKRGRLISSEWTGNSSNNNMRVATPDTEGAVLLLGCTSRGLSHYEVQRQDAQATARMHPRPGRAVPQRVSGRGLTHASATVVQFVHRPTGHSLGVDRRFLLFITCFNIAVRCNAALIISMQHYYNFYK